MLVLTHEIIDGPFTNRRIWDRLNIRNPSADAQRIAQRNLADLCLAVGIGTLRDTDELHFKPFVGRVGIRTDKTGQYGPQNTVRYKSRGGQPPANKGGGGQQQRPQQGGGQQQQRPAQQQPRGGPAKPWNSSGRKDLDDEIPF
jgi:hypothetical protein